MLQALYKFSGDVRMNSRIMEKIALNIKWINAKGENIELGIYNTCCSIFIISIYIYLSIIPLRTLCDNRRRRRFV